MCDNNTIFISHKQISDHSFFSSFFSSSDFYSELEVDSLDDEDPP